MSSISLNIHLLQGVIERFRKSSNYLQNVNVGGVGVRAAYSNLCFTPFVANIMPFVGYRCYKGLNVGSCLPAADGGVPHMCMHVHDPVSVISSVAVVDTCRIGGFYNENQIVIPW